nr:hypothetical protein GCM10020093_071210 [Planobispora longispora]
MQCHQAGTRVQPQLVGEEGPQRLIALQGLALPSRAVERDHVRGAQPLPEGMLGEQVAEVPGQRGVLAQRQPRLRPVLLRGQPLLRQADGGGPGERLVGEVGERRSPPSRQGLRQQRRPGPGITGPARLGDQGVESVGVGDSFEQVARGLVDDQLPAARLGVLQYPAQL